ncbi:hypothetical protein ACIPSA_42610 [Streptomyces sp. NPDC086549]|uniref:hypothetical protein n=1 Tax=Streptomyces sp. NPDC086549 TaxID=3365752 RepID=UPI00382D7D1D
MVRPADMLVVDIALVNLRFDGHRLVRRDPAEPAFVLIGLPPQHVREEVPPPLNTVTTALGPMKAVTAGSARLAFSIPDDVDGLELSLTSLLDWAPLVPMTVPTGLKSPDTAGSTVFQGIPRSVIEFPTRLLITYDEPVDWVGRPEPQQAAGRTALWHARLHGARDGEVLLRAFATIDNQDVPGDRSPLIADRLEDIVTLTSRAEIPGPGGAPLEVPSAPLHAEQFIVTPLGSSAHLHGAWAKLSETGEGQYKEVRRRPPNLAAYDHITGLGREQFIRVVARGRLCTGHESLHVHELTRVFVARPDDGIVAYLQREDRIIVTQPEVHYGADKGFTHHGREMPFRVLRITDRVTPPIEPKPDTEAFWVVLPGPGPDYEFTLIGTDSEGRNVSFTMPLVFVPDGLLDEQEQLERRYDPSKEPRLPGRLNRSMGGQVMAMAEPPAGAPGSTSHAVGTLTFGLGTTGDGGRFVVGLPHVSAATVRVPAVEQFIPNAGDCVVQFNDTYLRQTMEKHPAGAYLDLKNPLDLTFGAEKGGGVASPNAAVKLITSQAGVVPDVFKPNPDTGEVVDALPVETIRAAFGGAKLLGFIDLGRFLKSIAKDSFDTLRQLGDDHQIEEILRAPGGLLPVPVLRIRDLADGQSKELRYVWKTPLAPPDDGKTDILDATHAALTLDARTVRSKDAVDQATVQGALTNFALAFAGIARVEIADLRFRTGTGTKPDVTAAGLELKFSGALEFINTLRSALPADGFGAGAFVDVQPTGVRAGYKLALPSLAVGVLTLSNVSLAAELAIPFDGKPVLFRFSVSEREHPFNVTVSLFGGGGYFAMRVGAGGVEQIEGAIEFGGSASLNLGVASGGVSVMAGILFTYEAGDEFHAAAVSLSGYLRCNGFLTVLGIVTVSVEFYLQLAYEKHPDTHESVVRGRGIITVSVRIAFFSKSVDLELERSFSGAPGDPTFADCVLPSHWQEYCQAFAA